MSKKALILKKELLGKTDETPEKCLQIATAGAILGKDKTAAFTRAKWGTVTRCTNCEKQHARPPEVKLSGQSCQVVKAAEAVGS